MSIMPLMLKDDTVLINVKPVLFAQVYKHEHSRGYILAITFNTETNSFLNILYSSEDDALRDLNRINHKMNQSNS